MSPEEIALLQDSLAALRRVGPEAAAAFYGELFRLDPSTPALFRATGPQQAATFFHELDAIVGALEDLPAFVTRCQRVARLHVGRGVRPEHFRSAGAALDAMLRTVPGGEVPPKLSTAWRRAYGMAAEVMQQVLFER